MCFFVKSKRDDYITGNKLINRITKTEFSRQIKARYKFGTPTQYSLEKRPYQSYFEDNHG